MSTTEENKNTNNIIKTSTQAPELTNEMMFKMLLDTQKQLADAMKEQAAAAREARIPYVDPAVAAAKKQALEERRREVAHTIAVKVATKKQCPHTRINSDAAGNNSFSEKLNIKWMEHSNGIIKGVCGTCFSEFDARNPDDRKLLQRDGKAITNMGRARERNTNFASA